MHHLHCVNTTARAASRSRATMGRTPPPADIGDGTAEDELQEDGISLGHLQVLNNPHPLTSVSKRKSHYFAPCPTPPNALAGWWKRGLELKQLLCVTTNRGPFVPLWIVPKRRPRECPPFAVVPRIWRGPPVPHSIVQQGAVCQPCLTETKAHPPNSKGFGRQLAFLEGAPILRCQYVWWGTNPFEGEFGRAEIGRAALSQRIFVGRPRRLVFPWVRSAEKGLTNLQAESRGVSSVVGGDGEALPVFAFFKPRPAAQNWAGQLACLPACLFGSLVGLPVAWFVARVC